MTDTTLMPAVLVLLGTLLGTSWAWAMMIRGTLLDILNELRKRNYFQDLTNQVMAVTQTPNPSSPTKTTQLCETSNPLDESEPPSSTL